MSVLKKIVTLISKEKLKVTLFDIDFKVIKIIGKPFYNCSV